MRKKYRAHTNISLNVFLADSKSNLHVAFCPLSDGSSVFTTDDEHVQKGLEQHYKFGKLFRLEEITDPAGETAKTEAEEAAETTSEDALEQVEMSDWDSAKDYLADRFGLTRTSLRSQKAIVTAAKEHGIEIVITED